MRKKILSYLSIFLLTGMLSLTLLTQGLNSVKAATVTYNPYATLNTYSGYPGNNIQFFGYSFKPNENVNVRISGIPSTLQTVVSDNSGNINGSLTLPNANAGNYNLNLHGVSSKTDVNLNVYIQGYYPQVSPSSYYFLPGQMISYSGSGFAPNDTVRIFNQSNHVIGTFTTDSNGSFSASNFFTIPFSQENTTQTERVHGTLSRYDNTFSLTIGTFYPNINPSSYYIAKNSTFSISGNGFAPNEKVDLFINGNKVVIMTADGSGNVSFNNLTSPSTGSSFQVSATGEKSNTTSSRTITLAQ